MVILTKSGGTLGFTIQPSIVKSLKLKLKTLVTIELFDETGERSLVMFTRPLKKMGVSSLGVGICDYIVTKHNLKLGKVIPVRNPTK